MYVTHVITTCRAQQWINENLEFSNVGLISLFETNIRILGGLLSAYQLSGDVMFLEKATDLGDRFLLHFMTSDPGRSDAVWLH
jgi:uncharacterized protein YyaL (SSP411 family)